MRTAIVLAGGRSSRFGGNKLAAELDGRSLLQAAIAAVAAVTDEIIVAGPGLPAQLRAAETPVALVRDAEPFAGPLSALANVLGRSDTEPEDLAIVVGADMPRLVPVVLEAMLDHLTETPDVDAVLLERPLAAAADQRKAPRRSVLPLAVRVPAGARAARTALDSGDRSLQAFVDRLAHVELPSSSWLPLDPGAVTLLDVDTTADLEGIRGQDRAEPPFGA